MCELKEEYGVLQPLVDNNLFNKFKYNDYFGYYFSEVDGVVFHRDKNNDNITMFPLLNLGTPNTKATDGEINQLSLQAEDFMNKVLKLIPEFNKESN